MTPTEFIAKWKPVTLTERAAAQSHFNDLCALLGHEDPIAADPTGEWFTFEKGVTKTGGGDGFADVWKRDYFAWEYKKRKRDLNAALDQLVRYAAALENPPLQVACDTDRFLIRTAWTNAVPQQYEIAIDELLDPEKLGVLRSVFFDPEKLRPKQTRAAVTKEAADKFSTIALRLQGAGTPEEVAHFVNQLVFCFFASSVKLLPEGFFPKLLKLAAQNPAEARDLFDQLFTAMERGGRFGLDKIAWFNGGLFDGRRALPLDSGEIGLLQAAASLDWSQIDPTIFGTLFERFLDPGKRKQIGAHYTDAGKIMMIVEPVVLRPLRDEWSAAKAEIEAIMRDAEKRRPVVFGRGARGAVDRAMAPFIGKAEDVRSRFMARLRAVQVLDPACGSGNFLYLALQGLRDIEYRANLECEALGLPPKPLAVGPENLLGIEINPVAAELARTTIWIGDIQWKRRNGIYFDEPPILRKLDNIECGDALVETSETFSHGEKVAAEQPDEGLPRPKEGSQPPPASPPVVIAGLDPAIHSATASGERDGMDARVEPGHYDKRGGRPSPQGGGQRRRETAWPEAEFIVGNPPFLGGKLLRSGLGDDYVETLFDVFAGRVPPEADLVTYWFEKARAQLKLGRAQRAGLVATNSIRGGANRRVLERVAADAPIFEAWSDEPWVVEGAAVRVSLVCVDAASHQPRLDGRQVYQINTDLTAGSLDLTKARSLPENTDLSFQGIKFGGPFDVTGTVARSLLTLPLNPNGRPNSAVLRRWCNGMDITRRREDRWCIDFDPAHSESDAALFEAPFEYLKHAYERENARRKVEGKRTLRERELRTASEWWVHQRPRADMRQRLRDLRRFLVTAEVAKHRLFVFFEPVYLTSGSVYAIAREDDTTFGILQSRFHGGWSLRLGSSLEDRPRYTPTTTFETFPFPEGLTPNIPAADYADDPRAQAIAKAAKRLDELRNAWLNPPDLVRVEPEVVPGYPDRILPKDAAAAAKLRDRTLTKLYNQRPQWLDDAHRELDAAVAAAYGWPADISEEDALAKLLELNYARSEPSVARVPSPLAGEGLEGGKVATRQTADRPLIGREAFAKISEVEGIRLSDEAKWMFEEFDRRKLPAEERRRAILARFKGEPAE